MENEFVVVILLFQFSVVSGQYNDYYDYDNYGFGSNYPDYPQYPDYYETQQPDIDWEELFTLEPVEVTTEAPTPATTEAPTPATTNQTAAPTSILDDSDSSEGTGGNSVHATEMWRKRPDNEITLPGFNSIVWPNNVVPYRIDNSLEEYIKRRVESVIEIMNNAPRDTCIEFRKSTAADNNVLVFAKEPLDTYCYSQYVGFANVGEQTIYLSGKCSHPRFLFWTVLQALGLPAEHMRPDRDQYIEINWDNIDTSIPAVENAFKKYAFIDPRIEALGFDYRSRLLYSNNYLAKNASKPTLRAIDNPDRELGNPVRPTEEDFKKVAALYCDVPPSPSDIRILIPPVAVTPPGGHIAGLHGKFDPFPICECLDHPIHGSCFDDHAFEYKGMTQNCLGPNANHSICQCQFNFEKNVILIHHHHHCLLNFFL